LTDGTGFTITVGGNNIANATFKVDPTDAKKVIITLPDGTDVTGKEVKVDYNATQGNLKGTNGVTVGSFSEEISAVTVTVTAPTDGSTVTTGTPAFSGTTTPGATVTIEIDGVQETVTADGTGAWSYTPATALSEGPHTVNFTATKDGKSSATETIDITVDTTNQSTLTDLQLNSWNGTTIGLSPSFSSGTTNYTASVANSVYGVFLSPFALDPGAMIQVSVNDGTLQTVVSGDASDLLCLNVGKNVVVVKVTDTKGNVTKYTLTVTRASSGNDNTGGTGGGTGGGTTTPVTPNPNESGIETSVNGNEGTFATGTTATSGDRTTTSVQVDMDKLNEALSQGSGQKLEIHSPKDGDLKVDGLTAGIVKQLADKGASLEISNPLAIYPVPGGKMDLGTVSSQLGNAALDDIAVHIEIARSSDAVISNAKNKAASKGYELLVDPVDLDLTFTHDGKTVRSDMLKGYAGKYIALPAGIDPNRITTGVVVNPDGSVYHVPTVVTKIGDRYYAHINDLRSSGTYSVIWNPQDFNDVQGHWGKSDVNNIAARLDLAGTGNNTFSPNRNVTRSEFSEIVVLGLGLMRQYAPQNKFPDVPASAWYRNSIAIANEFGIVRGYDDGNFYGNQQITREQGIAMIARAYNLINSQVALSQDRIASLLAQYEDEASVSAWARADVARLIEAGILQGNGPQLISPQSNMTRAEVTALVARLLKTTNLINK